MLSNIESDASRGTATMQSSSRTMHELVMWFTWPVRDLPKIVIYCGALTSLLFYPHYFQLTNNPMRTQLRHSTNKPFAKDAFELPLQTTDAHQDAQTGGYVGYHALKHVAKINFS